MAGRLKQFDAYAKTLDDFRVRTISGGLITVLSSILIGVFVLREINLFLNVELVQVLFVDTSRQEKLNISIDIKYHSLPCNYLTVDAMDVSGDSQTDIVDHLYKTQLDVNGKIIENNQTKVSLTKSNKTLSSQKENSTTSACQSCYGAESAIYPCCSSCDDVKRAYETKGWSFDPKGVDQCIREGKDVDFTEEPTKDNEGCRVQGYLEVNKVSGNFHIAPGHSYQKDDSHIHSLRNFHFNLLNTSHEIFELTFGEKFPNQVNPLSATKQISNRGAMLYHYYVKVVPTTYVFFNKTELLTNQYSVTKHQKFIRNIVDSSNDQLPGTFFTYEISAIMVKYIEEKRSLSKLFTNLCTIVGGIFTVSTLIDTLLYRTSFVHRN